jgi:hypothetical protein
MKSRVELERGELWRDTSGWLLPFACPALLFASERVCRIHWLRFLCESSRTRFVIMDHAYLSERLKALQRELSQIAEHNRRYFAKRGHAPTAKARHKELRQRLYQIHSELHALLERTAA